MDSELLVSMLEMVDENKRDGALQPTVVLDSLESLPGDCIPILVNYLRQKHAIHWIATCTPRFVTGDLGQRDSGVVDELSAESEASGGREEILLNVGTIRIDLPDLKQRIDDLRAIVIAWMCAQPVEIATKMEFSESFLDALCAYPWPGDIEELDSTLRLAFAAAQSEAPSVALPLLQDKHLPVNVRTSVSHIEKPSSTEPVDLDAILEDVERTMIMRAVERFPSNKTAAAKLLNISRARLLRRLQQWGVQVESESKDSDDDLPVFIELE
jgi:DNA-binding protein Fis